MADRRPGRSVAEDSARNPARSSNEADEPHGRFAALVRADRDAILISYTAILEALNSPVIAVPRSRDQAMADASEVIADVAAGVQGRDLPIDDHHESLAWVTGQAQAEGQLRLADLLRAASALFEVTVSSLAAHVTDDPALMPCFVTAVLTLNESISRRVRDATLAHTSYLLEQVDQAHLDERQRIARDLHDRLGEGMSVAFRQLELHEILSSKDPLTASPRATMAKEAIAEAMRRLRVVTSDLRHDSVRSLERALIQYIDSVAPDVAASADVRLRVSGDETWAPPAVIDEAYLILREAIRNALRHGTPQLLLIGVALAPYELHAWVEDDGCGFALPEGAAPVFSGTGLTSMRERAALVGGQLTIASAPGQGTHVELLVPLQGHCDE
jgi:signal transduction histidine kinase